MPGCLGEVHAFFLGGELQSKLFVLWAYHESWACPKIDFLLHEVNERGRETLEKEQETESRADRERHVNNERESEREGCERKKKKRERNPAQTKLTANGERAN